MQVHGGLHTGARVRGGTVEEGAVSEVWVDRRKMKHTGRGHPSPYRLTDTNLKRARAMRATGMGMRFVAFEFGIPEKSLRSQMKRVTSDVGKKIQRDKMLERREFSRSMGIRPGPPSKLTPEMVASANEMRASGMSLVKIGVVLGVSAETLHRVTICPLSKKWSANRRAAK